MISQSLASHSRSSSRVPAPEKYVISGFTTSHRVGNPSSPSRIIVSPSNPFISIRYSAPSSSAKAGSTNIPFSASKNRSMAASTTAWLMRAKRGSDSRRDAF